MSSSAKKVEPKTSSTRPTTSTIGSAARTARNLESAKMKLNVAAAHDKKRSDSKASNKSKSMARKPLTSARQSTASIQAESKVSTGLKRPTAALASKKDVSSSVAKGSFIEGKPSTASNVGGLKKPSDVKAAPSSAAASAKKESASLHASPVKAARSSLNHPPGPVSASKDVKDTIYDNNDPLDVSLTKRVKEGGTKISQVPDKNNTQGKFFFSLKLKGEPIAISDQAKMNVAKLENRQVEKVDG